MCRSMMLSRQCASFLIAAAFTLPGTASETIELARGSRAERLQQPQLSIDAAGTVHVVYGVGDRVRYHRSQDGGKTFSAPSDLPLVHAMSLGMRRGPRVAATDSAICVTAIGGKQGKGRDGDLLAMQSVDGGQTWSQPIPVNDAPDAAREGLHAMAAGPQGRLCCVWLDLRNRTTEIMAATSSDGGKTWSKNVLVYKSPEGSVCECCHPSVAFDGRGAFYVQWRNSLAGSRDMYMATSSDGGKSFGKANKLGSGTWPLKACPMDGGGIACLGENFVTIWRRDKSVYLFARADGEERRLGSGEQPWIAMTKEGPFSIWLAKRDGAAFVLSPASTSPIKVADHATDPVIATGSEGNGPVVAAWESDHGGLSTIQCRILSN
jgi:hypothetical protein